MLVLNIIRPANCIFVACSIAFGALFRSSGTDYPAIILAVVSSVFIAAAGYVINDYYDMQTDVVNKPERVLPAGKIKPDTALIYAMIFFMIGIVLSFFIKNNNCIMIAFLNSIFLILYSKYFKFKMLMGNILVAILTASTFIYGAVCNANLRNIIPITIFAFLYTLLRELIKDAEDIEGDKIIQAETFAVKFGEKATIKIAVIPIVLIIFFLLYLFLSGEIRLEVFLLINIFGSLPLIFFPIYLSSHSEKKDFARISRLMKVDMLILLIFFWF